MKRKGGTQRIIILALLARGDGSSAGPMKVPLLAIFIAALWAPCALAEEKATWSVLLENDYFGSTDSNHTNGVRFGYLSTPGRGKEIARRFLRASPADVTRIGFALSHSILPRKIQRRLNRFLISIHTPFGSTGNIPCWLNATMICSTCSPFWPV